jgi:hypothetical protein
VTTALNIVFTIVLMDLTDIQFNFDQVLNYHLERWESLKRGAWLRGFLVGTVAGTLSRAAEAKLRATIVIEDLLGEDLPRFARQQ